MQIFSENRGKNKKNMKKKNIVGLTIGVLIIGFIILKNYDHSIPLYIGLAGNSQFDKIDLTIKIDNKLIFNDTVYYIAVGTYNKVELNIKKGMHAIEVSSRRANINIKKQIMINEDEYIIVEFYGESKFYNDESWFLIETRPNPYSFE